MYVNLTKKKKERGLVFSHCPLGPTVSKKSFTVVFTVLEVQNLQILFENFPWTLSLKFRVCPKGSVCSITYVSILAIPLNQSDQPLYGLV